MDQSKIDKIYRSLTLKSTLSALLDPLGLNIVGRPPLLAIIDKQWKPNGKFPTFTLYQCRDLSSCVFFDDVDTLKDMLIGNIECFIWFGPIGDYYTEKKEIKNPYFKCSSLEEALIIKDLLA